MDGSRSALAAAAARAAHLSYDGEPLLFRDPLAQALLGPDAQTYLAFHRLHGDHPILAQARVLTTFRSRVAEEVVIQAATNGVGQYVLVGAGLDSFAWRNPTTLTVFEVDHPMTQAIKVARVAASKLDPQAARFVCVDLEQDDLLENLEAAGFDNAAPCVVTWLGVTMYLSHAAVGATLAALGRLAPGSELVVEYALTDDVRDPESREYVKATTANSPEPWLSSYSPESMANLLSARGFQPIHQHRPADLGVQFWTRADTLVPSDLLVVAHARIDAASRHTA